MTTAVDFRHHALATQRTVLGNSHELVSQHAAKTHVAAHQLQVGFTDPRPQDTHQDFVHAGIRERIVRLERESPIGEYDRLHGTALR